MNIEAKVKVLEVQMTHAAKEREQLLTKMDQVEDKLDQMNMLFARSKGFIGAVMFIGTILLAGVKYVLPAFFNQG